MQHHMIATGCIHSLENLVISARKKETIGTSLDKFTVNIVEKQVPRQAGQWGWEGGGWSVCTYDDW